MNLDVHRLIQDGIGILIGGLGTLIRGKSLDIRADSKTSCSNVCGIHEPMITGCRTGTPQADGGQPDNQVHPRDDVMAPSTKFEPPSP